MGEQTLEAWMPMLKQKGLDKEMVFSTSDRRFKFGDGGILQARRTVKMPAMIHRRRKEVTIHLVPG